MKRKFYNYIKSNYVGRVILKARNKKTNKEMMLSVTEGGELYDMYGSHLTKPGQKRIWGTLFEFAKQDMYEIVPKGYLSEPD